MTEVQHFSHNHPLTKIEECGDFMCDGCKTGGFGKTYHCAPCDFNLHDKCATCPSSLLSYMHPGHELRLVFRGQEQKHQDKRMCDICDQSVEGIFYQCGPCGFDVHPLCTMLPQRVPHELHPDHPLEFRLAEESECMVCHEPCKSWRYRCDLCRFDVHLMCMDPNQTGIKTRGMRSAMFTIARVLFGLVGIELPA